MNIEKAREEKIGSMHNVDLEKDRKCRRVSNENKCGNSKHGLGKKNIANYNLRKNTEQAWTYIGKGL